MVIEGRRAGLGGGAREPGVVFIMAAAQPRDLGGLRDRPASALTCFGLLFFVRPFRTHFAACSLVPVVDEDEFNTPPAREWKFAHGARRSPIWKDHRRGRPRVR